MLKHAVAVLLLILVGVQVGWGGEERTANKDEAAAVFDGQKVHVVHLTIAEKEWAAMQPAEAGGASGAGVEEEARDWWSPTTLPAIGDFPYVHGNMEFDEENCVDIGIRFKGNSSYRASANGLKHSFKLDFNRFVDDQRFLGLTALNLNNNAMDPTAMRETLAYGVFRQAGIPASRTAYAKVYLSVPGKYERRYLGLYTIVEDVDKAFLRSRFETNKGLLLKPEAAPDLPYLGQQWRPYKASYSPQTEGSVALQRRLIDFVDLLHDENEEAFRQQIGSYVDVDEFLRFLAVNAILANLDSPLATGRNYFLHVNPANDKIGWIPWDLNEAFGGLMIAGSAEAQMDLSIDHPHIGRVRLIDRVLAIPEYRKAYRSHLKQILETCFEAKKLNETIDQTKQLIAQAVEEEKKVGGDAVVDGVAAQKPALKECVTGRVASIQAQLASQSTGQVLRPPAQVSLGQGGKSLGQSLLGVIDVNRDGKVSKEELEAVFRACDRDQDGQLSEQELESVTERLAGPGMLPGTP
ncbi:MAG TPA: CotH kinase family protein [Tepidisphaeraceae bacterium]|nr:CotH kinase family protein [Tepidisphaeraceae bacterium]